MTTRRSIATVTALGLAAALAAGCQRPNLHETKGGYGEEISYPAIGSLDLPQSATIDSATAVEAATRHRAAAGE